MKKIYILTLWIVLMLNLPVFSQLIRVMDQSGLLPIENVMVSGKAANNAVFTNLRGEFDLAQFITSDSLMFKHPTYQTTIVSLKQLKEHTEVLLSEKRINLSEIIISETKRLSSH